MLDAADAAAAAAAAAAASAAAYMQTQPMQPHNSELKFFNYIGMSKSAPTESC